MTVRIRSLAFVAAVCVAPSLLSSPAAAQAPDSARRGGFRPRIAAGIEGTAYDGDQRVPSLYGLAGLEWLHPRAPFSARFDVSYFRRQRDFGDGNCGWPSSDGSTTFCRYDDRYALVGASLDGRYTFLARARMRPYLVSGFGLYKSTRAWASNASCADFRCTLEPGTRNTFRESSFGLSMHGGFGFGFPIRRSELTLEFVLREQSFGLRQGYVMPVTLGIRF